MQSLGRPTWHALRRTYVSSCLRFGGSRTSIFAAIATGAGAATACYLTTPSMVLANVSKEVKVGDAAAPSIRIPTLPELDLNHGPVYDPSQVTVVFVLGGPGVGKGTQCAKLVQELDFVHISAGDLLREERARRGSPYGDLIDHYIREGKIVPHEITISLLHKAMESHRERKRFLIDGFPRDVEQGIAFEMAICPSQMVLFLECSEEEMLKRLSNRSLFSGRSDDNKESIKKRFQVFQEATMPVREFYRDVGKLRAISCVGSVDEVYAKTKTAILEATHLGK